jgi:hypothetical protein
MISSSQLTRLAFLVSLPIAGAAAQAPVDANAKDSALLAKACANMASLSGVAFKTVEAQDAAMMRPFRHQMPPGMNEDVEVKGEWCKGVTRVLLNLDADEVVLHGGRAAARSGGEWKLRRNSTAGGERLPFVLDPELAFRVLRDLPPGTLQVTHREEGKFHGQDLVILSASLDGDAARDLALTGVFPVPSAGGQMMMQLRRMGGGDAGDEPTTIDLAFYVDPAAALVHRLRVKIYQESSFPGQMQFQTADGREVDTGPAEEEEVQEKDEQGNRIYKRGLPVRKLGESTSLADLDATFSEHGKGFEVDVGEALSDALVLRGH